MTAAAPETTLSVALPPEVAGEVRDAVAAGEYASASELVGEALRDWRLRRRAEALELDDLRRAARDGMESGPSLDAEAAFAGLRARYAALAARGGPTGDDPSARPAPGRGDGA